MTPLVFASSESILMIILGGFINSIFFFAIVDLINAVKTGTRKKFFSSFLYSFKNSNLLYKGFIINAINNLLIFFSVMLSIISVINILSLSLNGFTSNKLSTFIVVLVLPLILIWVFLGLSQAMYILYEEPKTNLFKCIYRSFKMMKGNRWSLIGLLISFILWFFLGLIALVIGLLVSLARGVSYLIPLVKKSVLKLI